MIWSRDKYNPINILMSLIISEMKQNNSKIIGMQKPAIKTQYD